METVLETDWEVFEEVVVETNNELLLFLMRDLSFSSVSIFSQAYSL